MPTYAYACTECDNRFDAVQSFSDDALTVCPECQGRLRKVFNSVGVVFKGSGFYRNDSRSTDTASSSGSGKESGSDSTDSSSSTSSTPKEGTSSSSTGTPSKTSSTTSSTSSASTPAAAAS